MAGSGRYEVAGATAPWLLVPLVRTYQWFQIARERRSRRASAALRWGADAGAPLPGLGFGHLVLLRSFGNDGGTTIAVEGGATQPLETHLAEVARQLGYREMYALAYPAARRVPKGPVYCRAGDERWRADLGRALSQCSGIVVLLHDSTEFREGFAHELELISGSRDLSAKTLLVGSRFPSEAAYDVVTETLEYLGWPRPAGVPIACSLTGDGRLAVYEAYDTQGSAADEYTKAFAACIRYTPDFPAVFNASDGA